MITTRMASSVSLNGVSLHEEGPRPRQPLRQPGPWPLSLGALSAAPISTIYVSPCATPWNISFVLISSQRVSRRLCLLSLIHPS